ncbi:MAG: tRNA guanosine(34) transglycosylase Tgt [Vicinamibacterales bacterium]
MFRLTHTSGGARRGLLTTLHGDIDTPAFMPVGTQGAVKAVTPRDLEEAGASVILGNTYHLYLRPGDELVARRGGLHRFIGWSRPILTDSGGYQVFSLASRRKVEEQGVHFQSHLDGSAHLLTPEKTVDIQANLGSDIAMVLDECPALPSTADVIDRSVELTARWARRCRDRFLARQESSSVSPADLASASSALQFGVVHGGTFPELRAKSAELTVATGFEGYAIGGLSVGEPNAVMYDVIAGTTPLLPMDRPRYVMGVGTPLDILEAVAQGVDMFDCVLPTRNARNGQLFTSEGPINIKNAAFAEDDAPLDSTCGCYACKHFSKAYLRHLFMAGEMTSGALNTLHNLTFYLDTMRRIRQAIAFGTFEDFRQDFHRTFTRRAQTS